MGGAEEKFVSDHLKGYGLQPKRFSKTEKNAKKAPDFRVMRDENLLFYCEEKTIEEPAKEPSTKPRLDRVADKINEAVKQFDSVNPELGTYNVLIICNKDKDLNHFVLKAYLGALRLTDGRSTFRAGPPLGDARRRIKNKRFRIHLYIWFDFFQTRRKNPYFYFTGTKEQNMKLESHFGLT